MHLAGGATHTGCRINHEAPTVTIKCSGAFSINRTMGNSAETDGIIQILNHYSDDTWSLLCPPSLDTQVEFTRQIIKTTA